MITAIIEGQKLQLTQPPIASDTIDYLTVAFQFTSEDWDGMEKWAHFTCGETVYDIRLTSDQVRESDHLNLSEGQWNVYVHGNLFKGGKLIKRITTNKASLYVDPSGVLEGEPFGEVPPTAMEQLDARLDSFHTRVVDVENLFTDKLPFSAKYSAVNAYLNREDGRYLEHEKIRALITDTALCQPGDTFHYIGSEPQDQMASVCWYDEDGAFLSAETCSDAIVSAPEKTRYVRFASSVYAVGDAQPILSVTPIRSNEFSLDTRFSQLKQTADETAVKTNNLSMRFENLAGEPVPMGDKTILLTSEDLSEGFVTSNGTLYAQDNTFHSDYISLNDHSLLYVCAAEMYLVKLCAVYDSGKNFLGFWKDDGSSDLTIYENHKLDALEIRGQYPSAAYIMLSCFGRAYLDSFEVWYRADIPLKKHLNNQEEALLQNAQGNILHGKKYVACGDSFTSGDFHECVDENGRQGENSPDFYDSELGMFKAYPWFIAKRNQMELVNEAVGGSTMALSTEYQNGQQPIDYRSPFSHERYLNIPEDADYITLMFGLNEQSIPLGTADDTDNTTVLGAWNKVLDHLIATHPYAKIGIIIADAWMWQEMHDGILAIAQKWGIPCLDLKNGSNIPLLTGGKLNGVCERAKELRDAAFRISDSNPHPNVNAHEYRSTIIENFLRSL